MIRKGFTACAMAATLALSTTVVVLPPSIAIAQTSDAMPTNYFYTPAADADEYRAELQAFAYVAKLRHVYHTAAGDEKYADYYNATQQMRNAHDRGQYGCYIAKARLSLAILKAEGNAEARALDLAKVGLDLDETTKAIAVLEPASKQAYHDAIYAETDRATKSNRSGVFSNGLDRLKETVAALQAGQPTYEYDPFAIIDWGVTESYVNATLNDHGIDSEVRNQVVVRNLAEGDVDVAAIQAKGAENRAYLTGLFGEIKTGPRTPAEPAPTTPAQPTSEPALTTPAQPTSEPAPTTSAQPTSEPAPTTPAQPTSEPAPTTDPKPDDKSSDNKSSSNKSWLKIILGIVAALGIGGIVAAALGHLKLPI